MGKHSAKRLGLQAEGSQDRAQAGGRCATSRRAPSVRGGAGRSRNLPSCPCIATAGASQLKKALAIAGVVLLAAVIGAAAWSYVFVLRVEAEMQDDFVAQTDEAAERRDGAGAARRAGDDTPTRERYPARRRRPHGPTPSSWPASTLRPRRRCSSRSRATRAWRSLVTVWARSTPPTTWAVRRS